MLINRTSNNPVQLDKFSSSVGFFCSASVPSVMLAKSTCHPLSRYCRSMQFAPHILVNMTLSAHLLDCSAPPLCSITLAKSCSHALLNHGTQASHTVSSIQVQLVSWILEGTFLVSGFMTFVQGDHLCGLRCK